MHRGGYDHIPNRISAPITSIDNDPYRRRVLAPEPHPVRQPLLGNAPAEYLGYERAYAYNGPVITSEPLRRRGFDKGPYGEDLTHPRTESRQPLLKTPIVTVERVGGDMDISRSRSASPERERNRVRERRVIDARSVRDDRKKDRNRRKSRSRTRSGSRSRSRERSHRGSSRHHEREREREKTSAANGTVRDGLVCTSDNYYEFLAFFIVALNEKVVNSSDRDIKGTRKLCENLSRATDLEKTKIILPPDFNSSDRERMLYCDTTIEGLPSAIFFGSGYGPRSHYAKYSAAKDLVDKCHRIGVINSELHAAIGENPILDRSFQNRYATQISKAVNAVILLIKRMSHENLPPGFMTLRQLDPEIIDRFKMILRMVMIDVYYQGVDSPKNVPKALETGYGDRVKDHYSGSSASSLRRGDRERSVKDQSIDDIDDRVPIRQHSEEVLAAKEKELKDRMEQELARKRIEMEQEIRQKVLEEERAKIRAELEMEKKIESMMAQQQQYQSDREKEKREREDLEKSVENEFNATVGQLEQQFVEIRGKKLDHVHDMIQKSKAFQALQACSSTLTSLTIEQKQQLTVDLKSLLEYITCLTASSTNREPEVSFFGNYSAPYGNGAIPPHTSNYRAESSGYFASAIPKQKEEIRRLTVGDMRLRSLSTSEQLQLRTGSKVIAQDTKTGVWNLATVVKVNDDRVTLTVGTTTWKKYLDTVYIEDKSPNY